MSNFVKIIAISEEKKDKNQRIYKLVTVESQASKEVVDKTTGEVFNVTARPRRTAILCYKKSYLDDAPHYLWDNVVGDRVYGAVVQKAVAPYSFETSTGTKTVSKYTCFVEATQEDPDYEERVAEAFEAAGHVIVAGQTAPGTIVSEDAAEESSTSEEDTQEEAEEAEETEGADAEEAENAPTYALAVEDEDPDSEF